MQGAAKTAPGETRTSQQAHRGHHQGLLHPGRYLEGTCLALRWQQLFRAKLRATALVRGSGAAGGHRWSLHGLGNQCRRHHAAWRSLRGVQASALSSQAGLRKVRFSYIGFFLVGLLVIIMDMQNKGEQGGQAGRTKQAEACAQRIFCTEHFPLNTCLLLQVPTHQVPSSMQGPAQPRHPRSSRSQSPATGSCQAQARQRTS